MSYPIPEDAIHLYVAAKEAIRCGLLDESSDGGTTEPDENWWTPAFIQAAANYGTIGEGNAEITPWTMPQTVANLIGRIARLEADKKALLEALGLCDVESQVANGHIGTPAYEKISTAIEQARKP